MKKLMLCAVLLLPTVGLGCDYDRRKCEQQIVQLVSYRSQAIENAFGDMSLALPGELEIAFVKSKDVGRSIVYQQESKTLLLPRSIVSAKLPRPLRQAANYWPFYQNPIVHKTYPLIESIDDALWSVFLREAASSRGNTWPHSNCNAIDIDRRLPCRMLLAAANRVVKYRGELFFNENRIDRIWPDNIAAFDNRHYRPDDPDYADVLRFGGVLLLRPLIAEFGVPRVLAYVAQTPLLIEDNSLRISAQRYQQRARDVLSMREATAQMPITVAHSQFERAEKK